jgi:hypothetical protein
VVEIDPGRAGDVGEFYGGIGAADGGCAVGGGDRREEGGDQDAEEGERQRVADKVDQEKSAAGAADVLDHRGEVSLGEVVAHTQREGDVRRRERVADRVGADDRDGGVGGRAQVGADDVDVEATLDVDEDAAVTAADVEDAADGEWILPDRADDGGGVAEEAVQAVEVAISARGDVVRHGIGDVEDLRGVDADHGSQYGTAGASA